MAENEARSSEETSMDEKMELMEDKEAEDAEFYERIEAPKFVDFTVPDHYCPDDRYWFCLRVGCDRKHEEEMDSEAIYKNFVLRVMAARSPNVRLHKTLSRNASSKNLKCPLSAPPKSSKSRLSRLAIISSMSQKMAVVKEKVKPLSAVGSTPKAKGGKQVASKYLTTPRNKKCPPNPTSFRSVQNPKPPTVTEPKNRLVAKALVFHSPKKAISLKTSVELRTPLTKLCEGMKKLEITSQRKHVVGYSSKSAKLLGRSSRKSFLIRSSTKQKVPNKEKCRIKIPLQSHAKNEQDPKALRSVKSKSKGNLSKHHNLMDIVQHDFAVEANVKSRDDDEEHLAALEISGKCNSTDSAKEAVYSASANAFEGQFNSKMNSEPRRKGGNDDDIEGNVQEKSSKKEIIENAENLNDHLTELETSEQAGHRTTESEDKENASAFDQNRPANRSFNHTNKQTGKEILGMQYTDMKEVTQVVKKNVKGSAANGAPAMKLLKPKPTYPKPFRLRTDERGILREANLEKKSQVVTSQSQKEAAASRFQGGAFEGHHADIREGTRIAAVKTPKRQARTRTPTEIRGQNSTHQEQKPLTSTLKTSVCQDLDNDSRKTQCHSRDVLQHQRMNNTISNMTPEKHLISRRETSSENSKPREVEKQWCQNCSQSKSSCRFITGKKVSHHPKGTKFS